MSYLSHILFIQCMFLQSNLVITINYFHKKFHHIPQPAFTCSKLTIETLEQGVKYAQS